jgi:hypothetical protein
MMLVFSSESGSFGFPWPFRSAFGQLFGVLSDRRQSHAMNHEGRKVKICQSITDAILPEFDPNSGYKLGGKSSAPSKISANFLQKHLVRWCRQSAMQPWMRKEVLTKFGRTAKNKWSPQSSHSNPFNDPMRGDIDPLPVEKRIRYWKLARGDRVWELGKLTDCRYVWCEESSQGRRES